MKTVIRLDLPVASVGIVEYPGGRLEVVKSPRGIGKGGDHYPMVVLSPSMEIIDEYPEGDGWRLIVLAAAEGLLCNIHKTKD